MKTIELTLKIRQWLNTDQLMKYIDWKFELLENPDAKLDDFIVQTLQENGLMDLSKEQIQAHAIEVLTYLVEKSRRGFTANRANLKGITAKVKKYGVEKCKQVIDVKCVEWNTPEMKNCINPITIFDRGMSDNYFAQLTPEQTQPQQGTFYRKLE